MDGAQLFAYSEKCRVVGSIMSHTLQYLQLLLISAQFNRDINRVVRKHDTKHYRDCSETGGRASVVCTWPEWVEAVETRAVETSG